MKSIICKLISYLLCMVCAHIVGQATIYLIFKFNDIELSGFGLLLVVYIFIIIGWCLYTIIGVIIGKRVSFVGHACTIVLACLSVIYFSLLYFGRIPNLNLEEIVFFTGDLSLETTLAGLVFLVNTILVKSSQVKSSQVKSSNKRNNQGQPVRQEAGH